MNYINDFFNMQNSIIGIGIVAALVICIMWIIILTIQLSRLSRKYKKFMRGTSGNNLENMLEEYISDVNSTLSKFESVEKNIEKLQDQADRAIQKCNMVRYNAFSDTGSDLSFSISLLDNYNNGIILTGIYGRNETITYAKPINTGESKYQLSVEEQLVLDRCMKKVK